MSRSLSLLLAALVLAPSVLASVAADASADDAVPAPAFGRVDHRQPNAHLALSAEVGDEAQIRSLAAQLKQATPRATLAGIHRWMGRNLRHDADAALGWRTLDAMLKDRTYGGCADHAVVFGTLARAAGVPTTWVKTMDLAWIEDFRAGRPAYQSYRGHVFLEVFLDGRWHLLDAQVMRLYGDYDPGARILPGHRFAYDKGDDPFALVLSCRWELWKQQTHAYFSKLDPNLIPWSQHEDLLARWRVWITGNAPIYGYAAGAARRGGHVVEATFNTDWGRHLQAARGRTLIVTCQGRSPVLPKDRWAALLPPGWQPLVRDGVMPEAGFLAHRLPDGTRVILVPGQDLTAVQVGVVRGLAADER